MGLLMIIISNFILKGILITRRCLNALIFLPVSFDLKMSVDASIDHMQEQTIDDDYRSPDSKQFMPNYG